MTDGSAAEVGTIGNEGMVGLPIILGNSIAPGNAYVQVPGDAWQLDASEGGRACMFFMLA